MPSQQEPQPSAPSQVSFKTAFTVCFAVLLVAAGVVFVLKTLLPLTITVAAAMLAVALDHPIQALEKRKLSRGLALALVMLGVLVTVALLFLLVIPAAVGQGQALFQQWPQLLDHFRHGSMFSMLDKRFQLEQHLRDWQSNAGPLVKNALTPLLAALGGLVSGVAAIVTISFLVIFMLVFGGGLVRALLKEALPQNRWRYERVVAKVYASIGGYLGGILLLCSINASLTTTYLAIAHVPFFLPLGIISGISSFVPYVGPIVVGGAITMVALATGGAVKALVTAAFFVLYGQLEGNVLGPIIFRRTAHVNPLVTLLSILFMADLAGVVGAIIAVPAAAALQIIVRELLSIRREPSPPEEVEQPAPG